MINSAEIGEPNSIRSDVKGHVFAFVNNTTHAESVVKALRAKLNSKVRKILAII